MGTARTWVLLVLLASAACGGNATLPVGDAAIVPDAASPGAAPDTGAPADTPVVAPDAGLPSLAEAGPPAPAKIDGAAASGDAGLGAETGLDSADGPLVGDGGSDAAGDAGSTGSSTDGASDTGEVGGTSMTCPDPRFPVACPARGDVPALCWSAGTVCSTVANCGNQFYSCTTPSAQFVCSEMRCVFTSPGDGGVISECGDPNFPVSCPAIRDVPKLCWSTGTVCSTLVRCGSEFKSCLADGYTFDCAKQMCVPPADAGATPADAGG